MKVAQLAIYPLFLVFAGVYIWIFGQADVSWSEKPGGRKTHYEYEIYMKECITVWGKGINFVMYIFIIVK